MAVPALVPALREADSIAAPLVERKFPQYVKYMGSKTKIMGFVVEGLNEVYEGGPVCDLFAGSASLAGAIGHQVAVHSNDIQVYSGVLAGAYLHSRKYAKLPTGEQLVERARDIVAANQKALRLTVDYDRDFTIEQFNDVEKSQQALIERSFRREWHLFAKYYSGTWWSAHQCLWIDALRQVAEEHQNEPCYDLALACLMHAMAYAGQGTGHYAQYRDAKTESSLQDILIYRRRKVEEYFKRKYDAVVATLPEVAPELDHKITALDFRDCLAEFGGGTVYADPPYCFVHYSRFYHAIETLVRYDYPAIQVKGGEFVKGRYREDRHQSPFCIRSQVRDAFTDLFKGVRDSGSNLVLSYSNTGMITIEEVDALAREVFPGRVPEWLLTDHQHMTLGRQFDRHRQVKECLLLLR